MQKLTYGTSFSVGDIELLATGFSFTEGPVWDHASSALLFTDIPTSRILSWSDGEVTTVRTSTNKANGLAIDDDGRLIVCEHLSSRVSAFCADGSTAVLAERYDGKSLNSPNDVILDRSGRIYFTDPAYGRDNDFVGEKRPSSLPFRGVYMIPAPGSEPVLVARDFAGPNGLCLSADESRMYVNDSERRHIRGFDVLPDGILEGGDVIFVQDGDPATGVPDGMKIDRAGAILCSGPGGIWRISPDGELLEVLLVPEVVANFAFGGDDSDYLYITASQSLYRTRVNVPGEVRRRELILDFKEPAPL